MRSVVAILLNFALSFVFSASASAESSADKNRIIDNGMGSVAKVEVSGRMARALSSHFQGYDNVSNFHYLFRCVEVARTNTNVFGVTCQYHNIEDDSVVLEVWAPYYPSLRDLIFVATGVDKRSISGEIACFESESDVHCGLSVVPSAR